jgi:hypothetical protein
MAIASFYLLYIHEVLSDAGVGLTITPDDNDMSTAQSQARRLLHGDFRGTHREYAFQIDGWESTEELKIQLEPGAPVNRVLVDPSVDTPVDQDAYCAVLAASPLVVSATRVPIATNSESTVVAVELTPAAASDTKATYQALADMFAGMTE